AGRETPASAIPRRAVLPAPKRPAGSGRAARPSALGRRTRAWLSSTGNRRSIQSPPRMRLRRLALATLPALFPILALAHAQPGAAAGFASGFRHPLSGWDHILAMLAVGLWGAQLGAPSVWLLPVAFPMMMAVGGFLGLLGAPLPFVEAGIAA